MALRRKAAPTEGQSGDRLSIVDVPMEFNGRPDLADFLIQTKWEDGTPRETGSISIFCQNGRVQACITDKAQGIMAFITIALEGSILDELDHAIGDDDLVWKPYKGGQTRRGK